MKQTRAAASLPPTSARSPPGTLATRAAGKLFSLRSRAFQAASQGRGTGAQVGVRGAARERAQVPPSAAAPAVVAQVRPRGALCPEEGRSRPGVTPLAALGSTRTRTRTRAHPPGHGALRELRALTYRTEGERQAPLMRNSRVPRLRLRDPRGRKHPLSPGELTLPGEPCGPAHSANAPRDPGPAEVGLVMNNGLIFSS